MRRTVRSRIPPLGRPVLCAGTLLLGSCKEGVLDPAGPVSAAERLILLDALGIMLVVVVPVIVLTLVFARRYRASNVKAQYRPDWAYSGKIELVVWAIPAMVVMLLAGVEWIGSHALDPRRALDSTVAPLRIQVVSLDWKWLFIYPDHAIATVNELVVPAGTPLEFMLTSATVMNAFFVPRLGSMIYTMPGMSTHLNLMAERPGDYPGLSAHFSGDGFSDMRFTVHAVPPAEFARWLGRIGAADPPLDTQTLAALTRRDGGWAAHAYRGVDAGLFEQILKQSAPPAPAAPEH